MFSSTRHQVKSYQEPENFQSRITHTTLCISPLAQVKVQGSNLKVSHLKTRGEFSFTVVKQSKHWQPQVTDDHVLDSVCMRRWWSSLSTVTLVVRNTLQLIMPLPNSKCGLDMYGALYNYSYQYEERDNVACAIDLFLKKKSLDPPMPWKISIPQTPGTTLQQKTRKLNLSSFSAHHGGDPICQELVHCTHSQKAENHAKCSLQSMKSRIPCLENGPTHNQEGHSRIINAFNIIPHSTL